MKFHPAGLNLLIRPEPARDRTESGLYVPDERAPSVQYGEVLDTGPGEVTPTGFVEMPICQVGVKIAYNAFAGYEVQVGNETLRVIPLSAVLGHYEETP